MTDLLFVQITDSHVLNHIMHLYLLIHNQYLYQLLKFIRTVYQQNRSEKKNTLIKFHK